MGVERPTFMAELADGTVHRVEILHGDQLRAELEAPRHGIAVDPRVQPNHTTTLWVWAALVRTGVVTVGFQDFKQDLVVLGKAEAADAPVGPTSQDQPTAGP